MKRALIIGGYGGFGRRLARRLTDDGWQVLIGGRDRTKADAAAREFVGAQGIVFDRTTADEPQVAATKADLVVDAAGPFQSSDYKLVEACIAARVPYLDLADASAFVCGIGALDAKAKAAGVAVVSGVSSVPALSAAVVRDLSQGMERIEAIETAISATTKASSGGSVVAAALSYAGQPVRLWHAGRWTAQAGWSLVKRERFRAPGARPLHRLVGLAEVPDLALFPVLVPGLKSSIFRGGSEFSLQVRALAALGWFVRRGWLRSALPLAPWLAPLQQWSARFGGDRSAMVCELRGWTGERAIRRRWTLIAEAGQGQEMPTIAAQLLARRVADGQLHPGARDAASELELADFMPLLVQLPVAIGREEQGLDLPYPKVLGPRFAQLAPELRALHQPVAATRVAGWGTVRRGTGVIARLIGWVMRFPPDGDYPVEVDFAPHSGRERWTRRFGPHEFSSELGAGPAGTMTERFGPLRFHFGLDVDEAGGLTMALRRWTAVGLPLPLGLAPRISARESGSDGRFYFDVGVAMTLIGPVVHYAGWLAADGGQQKGDAR